MSARILIVDDDPASRATLSEVLEDEGYTIWMSCCRWWSEHSSTA